VPDDGKVTQEHIDAVEVGQRAAAR
jgi:hypothetical protein